MSQGTDCGPVVIGMTLTLTLSVRESPWIVLNKGVNKDYSGYKGKNGARRNRERLFKIPGRGIDCLD